jgi:hypothetical protein
MCFDRQSTHAHDGVCRMCVPPAHPCSSYTYRSAEEIRGDMLEAVKTAEAATMRATTTTVSIVRCRWYFHSVGNQATRARGYLVPSTGSVLTPSVVCCCTVGCTVLAALKTRPGRC